jgi:hypothetical protein
MNRGKLSVVCSLWLVVLGVVVMGAASATAAEPKMDLKPLTATPPAEQPKVATPAPESVTMGADEQLRICDTYIGQMKSFESRVRDLAAGARRERDVIKLNCVNEKLLTVRTLLKLVEGAKDKLKLAAASGAERERIHQFSKITVAYERATIAAQEAERCVGEELVYVGDTRVTVDVDPTVEQAKEAGFQDDPLPTTREPLASRTR